MLVSAIINVHNGEKYISDAIASALDQTYQDIELIIFDNCSNDGTADKIFSFRDNRIKYHRSEKFLSLGEARNNALWMACGELIAFLDSDDLWLPRKLELQVQEFKNQEVGIVISNSWFFNERGNLRKLYRIGKPSSGKVTRQLLRSYFISLETVVLRRSALDQLDHYFDSRFHLIEEYDLIIRLSTICELAYVDLVLSKWRMHDTSWTFQKASNFALEREIFLDKFCDFYPMIHSQSFSREYRGLNRLIAWDKSRNVWRSGDNAEARKILREYRSDNIKLRLVYIAMFAPFSVVAKLARALGIVIP